MSKESYKFQIDTSWTITFIILLLSIFFIVGWTSCENIVPFGILLVIISILQIYRTKDVPQLLLLFSVIGYINVSTAVLDYFTMGIYSKYYQFALRHSESGLMYAKMFLLNTAVISIMITPRFLNEAKIYANDKLQARKNNPLISYGLLFAALLIALTQFSGNAGIGGYVSNSNALYEYVVIFLIMGMYFAGERKELKLLYVIIGILYVIKGLLGGDRSSAFMAILVYVIYFFSHKMKIGRILTYSFAGILVANIVGVLRNSLHTLNELAQVLVKRSLLFFFSDTVSASFYAGITVVEYGLLGNSSFSLLMKWIKSLFFGASTETNIVRLASRINVNGGGGLYPSYFGFFGGYFGVIIGAIILGFIIRIMFVGDSDWKRVSKIVIIAMVFRWYLYTPVSLFRTILINFNIIFLVCYMADKAINRNNSYEWSN